MAKTEQHFELRIKFKTVTKNDEGISTELFRIGLAEGFPQFLERRLPFHKISPGDDYEVEIAVVEPLLLEELNRRSRSQLIQTFGRPDVICARQAGSLKSSEVPDED